VEVQVDVVRGPVEDGGRGDGAGPVAEHVEAGPQGADERAVPAHLDDRSRAYLSWRLLHERVDGGERIALELRRAAYVDADLLVDPVAARERHANGDDDDREVHDHAADAPTVLVRVSPYHDDRGSRGQA